MKDFLVFVEFDARAEKSDNSLMNVSPKLQSERIETTRPSSTSQVWNWTSLQTSCVLVWFG